MVSSGTHAHCSHLVRLLTTMAGCWPVTWGQHQLLWSCTFQNHIILKSMHCMGQCNKPLRIRLHFSQNLGGSVALFSYHSACCKLDQCQAMSLIFILFSTLFQKIICFEIRKSAQVPSFIMNEAWIDVCLVSNSILFLLLFAATGAEDREITSNTSCIPVVFPLTSQVTTYTAVHRQTVSWTDNSWAGAGKSQGNICLSNLEATNILPVVSSTMVEPEIGCAESFYITVILFYFMLVLRLNLVHGNGSWCLKYDY